MKNYEVIIIGGSYAGLSAALTLGRSLRKTLVIDSGKACNGMAKESHNFLTRDGQNPEEIRLAALREVKSYPSVDFLRSYAVKATGVRNEFFVKTSCGEDFSAKKLVMATGLKDLLPEISGLKDCWGISALHCPYCHGYEVRKMKTGVIVNGSIPWDFLELVRHWTRELKLFSNGMGAISGEKTDWLRENKIAWELKPIKAIQHEKGRVENIIFSDNTTAEIETLYVKPKITQTCNIPSALGCDLTDEGLIAVDQFQRTNVAGIYACGDNSSSWRSISLAVSSGTKAGMYINQELVEEKKKSIYT